MNKRHAELQYCNAAWHAFKTESRIKELQKSIHIYIFMIYYGEKLYNPLILDWKFSFS